MISNRVIWSELFLLVKLIALGPIFSGITVLAAYTIPITGYLWVGFSLFCLLLIINFIYCFRLLLMAKVFRHSHLTKSFACTLVTTCFMPILVTPKFLLANIGKETSTVCSVKIGLNLYDLLPCLSHTSLLFAVLVLILFYIPIVLTRLFIYWLKKN